MMKKENPRNNYKDVESEYQDRIVLRKKSQYVFL